MAKKDKEKFVSKEEFSEKMEGLESSIVQLVDLIKNKEQPPAIKELAKQVEETKSKTPLALDINDARAYQAQINPLWEEKAREILGEKLDHCEVNYPRSGGLRFVVVIKNEHSNAPKDYLERYKTDRRTREVGKTGYEGVIEWCKLIKQNLEKGK